MTHRDEPEVLRSLGIQEFLDNLHAEQIRQRLKNIRQGLFRREDKIMLLEGLLYQRLEAGEDVGDLISAIKLLQQNKLEDDRLYNGVQAQLNGFVAFGFMLAGVLTIFSFFSLPICNHSQSKFCQAGRVIPESIHDFFREPALLIPEALEKR